MEKKIRADEDRTVIFLDIDGVIQPDMFRRRFDYDLDLLRENIAREYNDPEYLKLDKYDVGAVYYDWDLMSLENLQQLLEENDAEIVLSSDWRVTRSYEDMKRLFALHNMDRWLTELVPRTKNWSWKYDDIPVYLSEHPRLKNWVVIDDMDMEKYFRGRFVKTRDFFDKAAFYKANRILKYGPFWEYGKYEKLYVTHDLGGLIEDGYNKVIFLGIDGVFNDDGIKKGEETICEELVYNLAKIVYKTEAEIILTSSWREAFLRYGKDSADNASIGSVLCLMEKYKIKIAGMTPVIYNCPDRKTMEIRTWLCRRSSVTSFVILDEASSCNWGWLGSHVVIDSRKCTEGDGENEEAGQCSAGKECCLNEESVYHAIKILNEERY